MNDDKMVDANIDAVLNPLSSKEKVVMHEMETKFFRPLKQRHWEEVEVSQYWHALKEYGFDS